MEVIGADSPVAVAVTPAVATTHGLLGAKSQVNLTQDLIEDVWQKGRIVDGYDPEVWRVDESNSWIKKADLANHGSKYGWEVDLIVASSQGGTEALSNLRPLQWQVWCQRNGRNLTSA